jgi:hypothetical protein
MRGDMAEREHGEVIRHQTAQAALRDQFLRWQCRARQNAVRMQDGRPSPAMQPKLIVANETLTRITVLINKREQYATTPEFRHMVLRTQDPRSRRESGLQLLAANYYQRPGEFSDRMTALFGPDSPLVEHVVRAGVCALEFGQPRQYYLIPCAAEPLAERDPAYQATYWHNRLFNPAMPPGVQVLAFQPDWATARADPAPT